MLGEANLRRSSVFVMDKNHALICSGTVSFGVNGSGQVLSEKTIISEWRERGAEISHWNNAVGDLFL